MPCGWRKEAIKAEGAGCLNAQRETGEGSAFRKLQLVLVLAVAETRGTEVVTGCVMKDFEVHAWDWILSFSIRSCWGVLIRAEIGVERFVTDHGKPSFLHLTLDISAWSLHSDSCSLLKYNTFIHSSPFPTLTPPKFAIPPGSLLQWRVLPSLPLETRNVSFLSPTLNVWTLSLSYFSYSFPPLSPSQLFWFYLSSHHFFSGLIQ